MISTQCGVQCGLKTSHQWHLLKETHRTNSIVFSSSETVRIRAKQYLIFLWLCNQILSPDPYTTLGLTVMGFQSTPNTPPEHMHCLKVLTEGCVCSENELKTATVGVGRLIQKPAQVSVIKMEKSRWISKF